MPRDCVIEILERRGETEVSWRAYCLSCGWGSEDDQRRAVVEQRAEEHRRGEVLPWHDTTLRPGWEHGA